MSSEIPIQNIYHLLCYAWNHLPEAGEIEIVAKDAHSLDELFTRVLCNGTQHLLRRGLDRDYILHREETARLRGCLDLTASMSRQTMRHGRMVCEFDEFSHNILHNRILKTTLQQLAGNTNLKTDTKTELHRQLEILQKIPAIQITSRHFRQVRLHRNNRQYRLLLNVCELIRRSILPRQEKGATRFREFFREEKTMAKLFEDFVRNFYRRHSPFKVFAPHLRWQVEADDPATSSLVPQMRTDVALISPARQIILDCKFYKSAFKTWKNSTSFNRDHLFQLYAYLENAGHYKGWHKPEGIILYPSNDENFHHQLKLNGYQLTCASINLSQNWQAVEKDLLKLILERVPN